MTVETTLARAEADLRAGRTPVALQRLRGLVGSCPADLTARRRLAEVYRLYGEPAQAGRWAYLDEERDPAETAAFEARYADPVRRMAALAWRGPEHRAPTATARARLAEVREAASAQLGRPARWWDVREEARGAAGPAAEQDDGTLFCAGFALLGLLLLGLAVLGAVTAVRWLL
ncbi:MULTISPECIES: DUF6584 family protein [Kitasatospora]|uniref:Uncharacterized protein n=1 Tax=Kitasatospora arboriphila TaxID=258052 RepID=A0ABP4EPF1_9ACTN